MLRLVPVIGLISALTAASASAQDIASRRFLHQERTCTEDEVVDREQPERILAIADYGSQEPSLSFTAPTSSRVWINISNGQGPYRLLVE